MRAGRALETCRYAGVEYAIACFCGHAMPATAVQLPISACGAMKCKDGSEPCGGGDIMRIIYEVKSAGNRSPEEGLRIITR